MQVYIEFALLENFCMDFALLCAAKAAVKNPARYLRITLASALGACFAVGFPLLALSGVWAVAVKIASGCVLAAIAGKFNSAKSYAKFTIAFTAATFVTGGALIALFAITGVSYSSGGGYILSSVPVGVPLFAVACVVIIAKKIAAKRALNTATEVKCKIYCNGKCAVSRAFYDSGNKVYLGGSPVSVAPRHVALQLIDCTGIKTFAYVHTVAGAGKLPVFTADKIEIDDGKSVKVRCGVLIGVSPQHINKVVLNPDLSED